MKILVLFSIGNRGKSETINILIDLLQQGGAEILATNHVPANRFRDRWCVMEYQGQKLGITTRGDGAPELREDFSHFTDCEICVCAARTHGGTWDFLRSLKAETLLRLGKASLFSENADGNLENERELINRRQAQDMLKLINKWL